MISVVVALVIALAALAAGYLARGAIDRGRAGGNDFELAIEAGRSAVDDAQFSMEIALGGQGRGLERELDQLYEARTKLALAIGEEHPLTRDLTDARDALELISADLQARGGGAAELAPVVRDARARYRRAANAIAALPR